MTGQNPRLIKDDENRSDDQSCGELGLGPWDDVSFLRNLPNTGQITFTNIAMLSISDDEHSEIPLKQFEGEEKRKVKVTRDYVANKFQRLVSIQKRHPSDMDEGTYLTTVFNMDEDGDSLLHLAIILSQDLLAVQLVNICPAEYFVSCPNKYSQTPLHLATITNQTIVARRLVVAGATVEARDKFGNTALHLACQRGLLEVLDCIIRPVQYQETKQNMYDLPYQKLPQNLELKNYDGMTCLHLAAHARHHDIIKILLENGADVNATESKTGRTILHIACLTGNLKLVKLLLRYNKCDINARAYDDLTGFDLARSRGHSDVIMELAVAGVRYSDEI